MTAPLSTVVHGDRVAVHLSGELDVGTAGDLRSTLVRLIADQRTDLLIDLTRVTFIDSTGLGSLVGALRSVSPSGGRLHLVADQESLLSLLRITGLMQLYTVHRSMHAALSGRPHGG